ncbi:MAG TPA: phytanoyl-CoA dioxygenase family protein [Thermoanaerobaculia bacterium]|nr:phytanoyl-CoA dioxygenase family protein [Thermoanaerobaculia bacterium]
MKLTNQDEARFADTGLRYLERLVPASRTSAAREGILNELARLGIRVGGKWHGSRMPQRLERIPDLSDVIPRDLLPCLNKLAGRQLRPAEPLPQLLLTPPQKRVWSVPHLGWHVDVKSPSRAELPGIQVFVLLDDVAPQGGGTVAIAGSHKLHGLRRGTTVSAHQILRTDPVYAALFTPGETERAAFMKPAVVRGVPVQVMEMCGKAGDVYLMDMRVLHAPAVNATRNARMMLTNRYLCQRP